MQVQSKVIECLNDSISKILDGVQNIQKGIQSIKDGLEDIQGLLEVCKLELESQSAMDEDAQPGSPSRLNAIRMGMNDDQMDAEQMLHYLWEIEDLLDPKQLGFVKGFTSFMKAYGKLSDKQLETLRVIFKQHSYHG